MIKPILKTVYKKKEAWICILFSLFPLLLIITSFLPTNFMQVGGDVGALSCIEFIDAVFGVEFQMILPGIAFMYLIVTCMHDEIKKGILYIYKDISYNKVILNKTLAFICWFFIFSIVLIISSIITYYLYIVNQDYSSGTFLASNTEDMKYVAISFIGNYLNCIVNIVIVSVISITLGNGLTLVIGIMFNLFGVIASDLEKIRYVFPSGYLKVYDGIGFIKTLFIIVFISFIYILLSILIAKRNINRIEF